MTKQKQIGLRIKQLLLKKNISQEKLCLMIKADRSVVSKWISGKQNMTIKSVQRIEKVLKQQIIKVL